MKENLHERCEKFRKEPKAFVSHAQGIISEIERENRSFHAFIQVARITTSQLEDHVERYRTRELFGSIMAVKATFGVKGFQKNAGFSPELDKNCREDSELVKQFREKGVFVVGVTNLDEACLHALGENKLHGRMLNPLDRERSVLGSSGGSAVAVSRGWADFALGTDSGGSVRAPAAATGIVGLIAGASLLSLHGSFSPAGNLDCAGIMAKSLLDLKFILGAVKPIKTTDLPELALLVPSPEKLSYLSAEFKTDFSKFIKALPKNFPVRELPLPFEEASQARKTLITNFAAQYFEKEGLDFKSLTLPSRAILEFGKKLPAASLTEAKQIQSMISEGLNALLEEGAMILTPTIPYPPPRWKEIETDAAKTLSNLGYFLSLVNLGGMSAISFPLAEPGRTIPLSLQLIGSTSNLGRLVSTALALRGEKVAPSAPESKG